MTTKRVYPNSRRGRQQLAGVLVSVAVVLTLLASSGSFGLARAGPDIIPPGGGGGSCPTSATIAFDASVMTNVTNVTIQYLVSYTSSSEWDSSNTNVSFGLNTSYSFPAEVNQVTGTTYPNNVYINFLDPGTTYYYELVGWASCSSGGKNYIYHGSYYSSWTTGADQSQWITGKVTNVGGQAPTTELYLTAQCANPAHAGAWEGWALTSSTGAYNFSNDPNYGPPGMPSPNPCLLGGWGLNITVQNNKENLYMDPGYIWPGYWNETIVTYGPQVTNFALPSNFVKYSVVQIQDYSNANTANGYPNSTISYKSGSSYTTFSSHCWTALFLFSGCSKTSNPLGSSTSWSAIGGNLVITQNLWESGTVLFDAMARTACVTAENYYAAAQPPVNQPATWPSGDNITMADAATNSSIYPIWGWGAGFGDQGVPVYSNRPDSGNVTVSSTSTTTGLTKGFGVDLGIDIFGVDLFTTVFTDQWSQTSTHTSTDTLLWQVNGNSVSVPICYAVYGVGGSSSASGSTADAIGITAFSPTLSGGQYSCPATQ